MNLRFKILSTIIIVIGVSCVSTGYDETNNEIVNSIAKLNNDILKDQDTAGGDCRLVVYSFTQGEENITYLSTYITDKFTELLSKNKNITVLNRTDLDFIITEIELQQTGLIDYEQQVEIGKLNGANKIVTGKIVDIGESIEIVIKITEIETSKTQTYISSFMKSRGVGNIIKSINNNSEEMQAQLVAEIEILKDEINQIKSSKQAEIDMWYEQKTKEVELAFKEEEILLNRKLEELRQEIREKSSILSALRSRQNELSQYESEIQRIENRISAVNNAIDN